MNTERIQCRETMKTSPLTDSTQTIPDPAEVLELLSSELFGTWYQNQEFRRNIREGQPYFNGATGSTNPTRHSPSKLLKCHRKQYYNHHNAPEETSDPDGIFWFGTEFEKQLVLQFLDDIAKEVGGFVRKSDWVDFTEEVGSTELQFKGETDPLIVDDDAVPIVPLEVKTRDSVDSLDSPSRIHKAQLHAYIRGLSQKYNIEPPTGVILYGCRKTFRIKCFQVPFSEEFWSEIILEWAGSQTEFLVNELLPPADPEHQWECGYCSYRERCGKGSAPASDYGDKGFVWGFSGYPLKKVKEYLENNPDDELTPALAAKYSELAATYAVQDWLCTQCGTSIDWKQVDSADEPLCPRCAEDNILAPLAQPGTQDAGEPDE